MTWRPRRSAEPRRDYYSEESHDEDLEGEELDLAAIRIQIEEPGGQPNNQPKQLPGFEPKGERTGAGLRNTSAPFDVCVSCMPCGLPVSALEQRPKEDPHCSGGTYSDPRSDWETNDYNKEWVVCVGVPTLSIP